VASFSLYDKNTTFSGVYVVFMVNRMQILYLLLIMPSYLVHPYMIWVILALGILSQLNLLLLSKWFSSNAASRGYQGFVQLFGERMLRFFAFLGLFIILIKIIVLTLGIGTVVHQYIFPSMNSSWFILFIFLICYYVAAQGVEKTVSFVVIVFLSTIWMLIVFFPFFLPPTASLHNLYPLIPTEESFNPWKQLLFVWSALSGPEFLVFLTPWLKPQQNMLKYMTIANAISVVEYVLLFVAALLFFGSTYLSKTRFPVVDMIGYLQFPLLERMDLILISVHLFVLVFVLSIFMLYFYGAVRIVLGTRDKQTTRFGFTTCWLVILLSSVIANEWFWKSGEEQSLWLNLEVWSRAVTLLFVPAFLLAITKLKEKF
jgi:hypothetical protein